jgi:hypothetical protein
VRILSHQGTFHALVPNLLKQISYRISIRRDSFGPSRFLLVQICADVNCVRRVNGTAAFLNMLYLALLVHDEGGATGKLRFLVQDSVSLRDFAFHVAKKREFDSDLLGECCVGGGSIDADAKYGGVVEVDLARVDTSLVSLKFFRSTTSEGKNVERQNNGLLAAEITQLHGCPLVAPQGEVWRCVSDLQEGMRELGLLLLLRLNSGQTEHPCKEHGHEERNDSFHRWSFLPFHRSRIGKVYTRQWQNPSGTWSATRRFSAGNYVCFRWGKTM